MNGDKPVRRPTKLNNWILAVGLAMVAFAAYALIAVRIHVHGIY